MHALPLILSLALLVGCTTANTLALPPPTAPQGAAAVTGNVPLLLPDPTGQTTQLTEAEKAATRAELEAAAAPGRRAATGVNAEQVRSDVARLKAEALAEQDRRLREIEDRDINVAEQTIVPE